MVTANDNLSVVKKAITIGAKNFVVKPLKIESVLPRLRAATRK
jgi:AmiR/NasT family two-component response regulator